MNTQLDQWDEALRGKKMSDATGRVIFKYQMPVLEQFDMTLPTGVDFERMQERAPHLQADRGDAT